MHKAGEKYESVLPRRLKMRLVRQLDDKYWVVGLKVNGYEEVPIKVLNLTALLQGTVPEGKPE